MECGRRGVPHVPVTYSDWNTGIAEVCIVCKDRFVFPLSIHGQVEQGRYMKVHANEFIQKNDPRFIWAKHVGVYR